MWLCSSSGAGPSRGATFESIYDSIKMKKSSFYFNQFKDVQTRKLKSENLKLEKELGTFLTLRVFLIVLHVRAKNGLGGEGKNRRYENMTCLSRVGVTFLAFQALYFLFSAKTRDWSPCDLPILLNHVFHPWGQQFVWKCWSQGNATCTCRYFQ